jgi:archaellum biogenesis ATPase FlaH
VGEPKVKLKTEDLIEEKLENEGSVIVVGLRLSGLTTLYQNYFLKFPEEKLCLEYVYSEDDKNSFIKLINYLEKGKKIALIAPEYLYERYFEEYKSEVKNEDRLRRVNELINKITIVHKVSREEASKYLEELIKMHMDYKDKFDDELKDKILDLVEQKKGNYPLKLLKAVFDDVIIMMQNKDKEYIKDVLNKKINQRREAEKLLGVSTLLWSSAPAVSNLFGIVLSPLYLVLFVVGTLSGELIRFIKEIWEKKAERNPFGKVIELKKYWDSLNESERKMLCYKLDSRHHLVPGKSEEYLKSVFGDELKDLEEKIEEAKTYVQSNLEEFQKKLEELEENSRDILNKLAEFNEDIKEFKNVFKSTLEELRKLIEEKIKDLKNALKANVVIADRAEFEEASFYSNVKVEGGKLKISVIPKEYRSVVIVGGFEKLVNEVVNTLRNFGVVVVKGPKGIGKSVLGATVVWEMLRNSYTGLVVGVEELDSDHVVAAFNSLLSSIEKLGHSLLVVFDPSTTYAYMEVSGKRKVPKNINTTLKNLLNSIKLGKQEMLLIILPMEMYNTVDQLVREKLSRSVEDIHKVIKEITLKDEEFLAGVIREYSGECQIGNEKLSELAGKVAGFDSGYTLIARLVGEELAKNCNVNKIEELIDKSRGRAEEFFLGHINSFFDVIDDNRASALVEIFALRRPFVDILSPGRPILTPGIVEIIRGANDSRHMNPEMVDWLAYRQHDLIEETISKMLNGEDLGEASNPWRKPKVIEKLREVSEKMKDVVNANPKLQKMLKKLDKKMRDMVNAVIYFDKNYGKDFMEMLKNFSDKCWRRAALIIGISLSGYLSLPKAEDLPENIIKSLNDALKPCGVDDYLLVGNMIPLLIEELIFVRGFKLISIFNAFVDMYNDAIGEIKNVLNNARNRGVTSIVERFYWLGLASIVAYAVKLGKDVSSDDADATLHIASFAIQHVISTELIKPILDILEQLREKAPHRYLELLAAVSTIKGLGSDTAWLVFNGLNDVLDKHRDEVEKHDWTLVTAVYAYAELLNKHLIYFYEKVEEIIARIGLLLVKLGNTNLSIIAWASALMPALDHVDVREFMERKIDIVEKVKDVINKLNDLRERVGELLADKEFVGYMESRYFKADENLVKREIQLVLSNLKHSLASYKLENDQLDEAAGLFEEVANGDKEVGEFENYLISRSMILLLKTIKNSLVGNELVREYAQLFSKALGKLEPTPSYLDTASCILGEYLVSLALTNNVEEVSKLLEEHWKILNGNEKVSVLTRLMLNVLLGPKGKLSDRVKDMLVVGPEQLIKVFKDEMLNKFLPALKVAYGLMSPKDGIRECKKLAEDQAKIGCKDAVLAVEGLGDAIVRVGELLITSFRESILEKETRDLLKELGVYDNELLTMLSEFMELAYRLDGRSLIQLIAPEISRARLALMLYALINGNHELVKAHALYGTAHYYSKLLIRLFLEAYKACCDLSGENFRKALARLFFYHY